MLTYQILEDDQIVIVEPLGPLSAEDFRDLDSAVDAFLVKRGFLKGLLVHAAEFPGWENFSGLLGHLRFVREHHDKIKRVTVASDSVLADLVPRLARHFTSAEAKGFAFNERERALDWLRTGA